MKAITWLEKVAEFLEDRSATRGRAAWATKDKLVEILSRAPLTKRAPRYPVVMLAAMEELVLDELTALGWRIWAWVKLIKVWASLRWSDVQAIIPQSYG